MTLQEIYQLDSISVRSYNVCNGNGLTCLESIISHYDKYTTFDNLRNCGKKSNEELIRLSLKYKDIVTNPQTIFLKEEDPLTRLISNLNRSQREVINSFIEINLTNLSRRSQNAICLLLKNNLRIGNFSEKIILNNLDLKNIDNIGSKSLKELTDFKTSLINFIYDIATSKSELELVGFKNRFLLQKTYSLCDVPDDILASQSIFTLIDYLIHKDALYESHSSFIFRKGLKLYLNQPELTSDTIAEHTNLSRERVRQIRKGCLDQIFEKLAFVKNIEDNLLQKYNFDVTRDFTFIDEKAAKLVNEINGTNFTPEFISCLLYAFWSERVVLVGSVEDVLQPRFFKSRGRHNWKNFFLINKTIANEFDFTSYANDLELRLVDRIEDTYSFNFKSYLFHFLKVSDYDKLQKIIGIAEKILNAEFGLYIDIDDNLTFTRTTVKQVHEYALEILERIGEPMKIQDIYNILENEHPDVTAGQDALRGSMQRVRDIIHFGRTSTFGLRKWEDEKEGIRGGTIRSIVLAYLEDKQNPIHINEITEEVVKYRPSTNATNIMTNIKLDPHKRFIFFNQNFIGMQNRKYSSILTRLPKFLGKTLSHYIRSQNGIDKADIIKNYTTLLDISEINMNHILSSLIEKDFISIDSQNKLTV